MNKLTPKTAPWFVRRAKDWEKLKEKMLAKKRG